MKEDIPWAYVAMIFIAFVSWVYGRLKEAAEIRRTRATAKRAAQKARNHAQPVAAPSPYRSPEEVRPAAPAVPAPLSVPTLPADAETPKTFRELFEMLQEQAAPVAEEIPRFLPPPPLPEPVKTAETIQAETIQAEVDRKFYGPARIAQPAPPLQVERLRGKTSSNLNRILKNRSTLREAMILKEMLDTPISIRE